MALKGTGPFSPYYIPFSQQRPPLSLSLPFLGTSLVFFLLFGNLSEITKQVET